LLGSLYFHPFFFDSFQYRGRPPSLGPSLFPLRLAPVTLQGLTWSGFIPLPAVPGSFACPPLHLEKRFTKRIPLVFYDPD